jgi:hypothetical protein
VDFTIAIDYCKYRGPLLRTIWSDTLVFLDARWHAVHRRRRTKARSFSVPVREREFDGAGPYIYGRSCWVRGRDVVRSNKAVLPFNLLGVRF